MLGNIITLVFAIDARNDNGYLLCISRGHIFVNGISAEAACPFEILRHLKELMVCPKSGQILLKWVAIYNSKRVEIVVQKCVRCLEASNVFLSFNKLRDEIVSRRLVPQVPASRGTRPLGWSSQCYGELVHCQLNFGGGAPQCNLSTPLSEFESWCRNSIAMFRILACAAMQALRLVLE